MTAQPIIESGMLFGPYPEEKCFYIEKSKLYAEIQDGVKMAEFLLLKTEIGKPPAFWVVEAKSSSPKPETESDFDEFIAEISEKLINAFSLGWAACLQRHAHAAEELPETFRMLDLSQSEVRFILVIKGHEESWMSPIQDELRKALNATTKTWSLSPNSVVAINDDYARKYGLIG